MAYIGKEPTTGNFIYADDITTSSTNTYNILVGGVAFSPESANHLIVSLNGVIQKANSSFSVSGSQITFIPSSGTLSSSDSIDFILILGSVNDVGVATTVSDSAITKNKLNLISTSGSPGLEVKGDGSSENGTIQLNCSQNSHGVKISSPAHSAGQSYELILPTGNVTADKVLKVASVSGSGTTGIGQLSFGDAGSTFSPNWYAYQSSDQTLATSTTTRLTLDTEGFDSDNGFTNTSGNYNYTIPSGEGGKYVFYYQVRKSNFTGNRFVVELKKNNSHFHVSESNGGSDAYDTVGAFFLATVSAGDVFHINVFHNDSGNRDLHAGDGRTYFGGFKLI